MSATLYFLECFIILFVVVDPVGIALLFISLTEDQNDKSKKRIAARSILLASGLLFFFLLAGESLLRFMNITMPAMSIAGGILLFLLAIEMVFARQSGLRSTTPGENQEAKNRNDVSVFPLAFPLITGPGAITTILLLTGQQTSWIEQTALVGSILCVMLLAWLSLLYSFKLIQMIGETGVNFLGRLFGLLLAALAVQYVIDGIISVHIIS